MGTRAQQRETAGGGRPGRPPACPCPSGGPGLTPGLPLCRKMERQVGLLNAVWEPSADGLVTRLGQCWRDASSACRGGKDGDPGPAPSLGPLPPSPCPPGSLGQLGSGNRQDMAGGIPSPSPPVALTMCCLGPETVLSPASSGPAHLLRGPETWVWTVVRPNLRACFCSVQGLKPVP